MHKYESHALAFGIGFLLACLIAGAIFKHGVAKTCSDELVRGQDNHLYCDLGNIAEDDVNNQWKE